MALSWEALAAIGITLVLCGATVYYSLAPSEKGQKR